MYCKYDTYCGASSLGIFLWKWDLLKPVIISQTLKISIELFLEWAHKHASHLEDSVWFERYHTVASCLKSARTPLDWQCTCVQLVVASAKEKKCGVQQDNILLVGLCGQLIARSGRKDPHHPHLSDVTGFTGWQCICFYCFTLQFFACLVVQRQDKWDSQRMAVSCCM